MRNNSGRFFKITTGKAVEKAKEIIAQKKIMQEGYRRITREIGANDRYWHSQGKLDAFSFDKPDLKLYKKVTRTGGYMPKKNTSVGKEIHKKLDAIDVANDNDLISFLGIPEVLFDIPYLRYSVAHILPYDEPLVIIKMPWKSVSPRDIEAYKKDDDVHRDEIMDFLCFEPLPEMLEIEEYEIKELIDAYNTSLEQQDG